MRVAPSGVDLHWTCTVTFGDYPGETNQPFKVDWGDGTVVSVASGAQPAAHDYAKPGPYKISVRANDVGSTIAISAGAQAAGKAYDPLKVAENRWDVSRANEKAKAAQILGVRSHVG